MTTKVIFDGKTFDELYADSYVRLCRYANKFLNNMHESQEIVQNSFLDLHKNPSAVNKSVVGWLLITVKNKAYTHIRTQVRRKAREEKYCDFADHHYVDSDNVQILLDSVTSIIKDLPEEERAVIMSFLNGCGQSETAKNIGMNQATVSRRFKRAIKHIREEFSEGKS